MEVVTEKELAHWSVKEEKKKVTKETDRRKGMKRKKGEMTEVGGKEADLMREKNEEVLAYPFSLF